MKGKSCDLLQWLLLSYGPLLPTLPNLVGDRSLPFQIFLPFRLFKIPVEIVQILRHITNARYSRK